MKIVITAGGTNEKIDEVRKITNMSTGRLGSQILDEMLKQQGDTIEKVYYLSPRHAVKPTSHEKVEWVNVESVSDLKEAVEQILTTEKIDMFVHSMAISDYTTDYVSNGRLLAEEIASKVNDLALESEETRIETLYKLIQEGAFRVDNSRKISSSSDDLLIRLKPTEKVISLIKKLQPTTFLIGFKLLEDVSEEELFTVGFNLLRKNRCNLVLANDLKKIREGVHTGLLIYPEKKHDKFYGKDAIAEMLVETAFKRMQTRHSKSVCLGEENEVTEEAFEQLQKTGKILFESGFLPSVECGTYGNMSVKTNTDIFITGRNVHKGELTKDTVVSIPFVEEVEDENIYTKVSYKGKVKPSIDTSIHHFIYKNTNHEAILHIHTDRVFEGFPITDYNHPCGSENEMKSILDIVLEHPEKDIVQMKKHGLLVMGKTLDECMEKLKTLFKESLSIEKKDAKETYEAYEEWKRHLFEVGGNDKSDFLNDEKYSFIRIGEEVAGVLFQDIVEGKLRFVIYQMEKYRGKGQNIGKRVMSILKKLAKTKNIKTLQLVTVDACGVREYYEKKLGFTYIGLTEGMHTLEMEV